jgi:glutamyl-tRNA reductase
VTRLYAFSLAHPTAPVEVREAVAASGERLLGQLQAIKEQGTVQEALILSTCNRHELYVAADGPAACEALLPLTFSGHPAAAAYLSRREGDDAVRHLFRVAASLESQIVGEAQILGQVKEAFALANAQGTIGPLLQRVVPRALAAAKRVRTETRIGENAASVASVAVDLAGHIFADLRSQPVLIVGAGKMAELMARHLLAAQVQKLWIVNRTRARAEELAARLGGTAHDFGELESLLQRAAVVLCSTGANEPVLRRDLLFRIMKARRGRWLFLIDIAVPRDIEPAVGDLENVYLYDIDALEAVVEKNRGERQQEAAAAARILDEELQRFARSERTQGLVPTIRLLRERSHRVAQREVERLLPRLSGASERDRQLIGQMAEAIVNKLLHGPLTALKRDAGNEEGQPLRSLEEAVRLLWTLDEEPAAEAEPRRTEEGK